GQRAAVGADGVGYRRLSGGAGHHLCHRAGAGRRWRGGGVMDYVLAALVGCFVALGVYLLLSRSVIRMLLGLVVFGNGVNLLIFTAGRLTREIAPIVPAGLEQPDGPIANPLPQALILTAIVIGFAMFSFLLVLAFRAYQSLDADNTDTMRVAEPVDEPNPPLSY